jgi:hypothetical protein
MLGRQRSKGEAMKIPAFFKERRRRAAQRKADRHVPVSREARLAGDEARRTKDNASISGGRGGD